MNYKKEKITYKRNWKGLFKILLLLLILIFVFFRTYSLHSNYKFPIHVDEWQHLAQIVSVSEGKLNWNPYFNEPHLDLELGFHFIWAIFAVLLGSQNFIIFYAYLPAIFAVLSSIALFIFVKKITKNYCTAIFSVLFFALLKSSVNILGIDFFTPLTMSIPFMYLFMLFFIEGVEDNDRKKFLESVLLLAITFLIHPPSAAIFIPAAIIYLLLNKKFIVSQKKILLMITALAIVAFSSLTVLLKISGRPVLATLAKYFIFPLGWTGLEIKYFLPFLYTIPATILALIGIYTGLQKPKENFIVIFAIVTTALTAIFHNYEFSILAPYQRVLYYALLSLVPLSAIGATAFLKYVNELLGHFSISRNVTRIIIVLITIIIFVSVFASRYGLVDDRRTYSEMVVYQKDYDSLKWTGEHYSNKTIMTPVFMSSAVYPISKNMVQALIPAQLGTFDRQEERIEDAIRFYNSTNCTEMSSIVEKWKVDLIVSRKKIACPDTARFIKNVYDQQDFVYENVYEADKLD